MCVSLYSEYTLVTFNWVQCLCQPAPSHPSQRLQVPLGKQIQSQGWTAYTKKCKYKEMLVFWNSYWLCIYTRKKLQVVIIRVNKYPPIREYEGFAVPAQFRKWESWPGSVPRLKINTTKNFNILYVGWFGFSFNLLMIFGEATLLHFFSVSETECLCHTSVDKQQVEREQNINFASMPS